MSDNTSAAHEVFRHPNFLRYQAARFLSVIAIQMQAVAIGWQVYAISSRPLDLGFVGLSIFLPFVVFALVAGDVADRFDRRRILIFCYAALALCAMFLVVYSATGKSHLGPIYAVLGLFGATRAFTSPAGAALLPHLVPQAVFSRAVAWSSSVWQFSTIAGPALGGILYGIGSATLVYVVCSLLMLASMGLIISLTVKLPSRAVSSLRTVQRLVAGLRFVWGKKLVLGAISLDLFAVLFGGAVALLPIFAKDILHVGPFGLGVMRSAPAVGAVSMAVWLAYNPLKKHVGKKMLVAVAIFGVATCIFGFSQNYGLSLACLVVLGAADMISVVVRQNLIQLGTPDEMRGRVSAVDQIFIGASNELGEFESGLTADLLGTVPAVIFGGIGTCLVVLIWSRLFPQLRRADNFADVHGETL